MPSFFAYLAPFALMLQLGSAGEPLWSEQDQQAQLDPREAELMAEPGPAARDQLIADWINPPLASHQVRIEQRVTVRISPRSPVERQSMMAEVPQAPRPSRYEERKIGKCVPVSDIAAVQTGSGNRIVLYLRDRRMVSAKLQKSCRARDFYSGFYVERNKDGKLCVDRDKLQSRAGANCELERIRELVPIYD